MAEKKKRSRNWLVSEKNLLLNLVERHLSIIENKQTDEVTVKQKAEEWKLLSHEYNTQTVNTYRTAENLRAQWESMRKEANNDRMYFIHTDVGNSRSNMDAPFYKRILALVEPNTADLRDPLGDDTSDTGDGSQDMGSDTDILESQESSVKIVKLQSAVPDHIYERVTVKGGDNTPCVQQSPVLKRKLKRPAKLPVSSQSQGPVELAVSSQSQGPTELPVSSQSQGPVEVPVSSQSQGPAELPVSSQFQHIEVIENQRKRARDEQREASLHNINMQIKLEEFKIKKEEVKQNKIKTRLLLLELTLKKRNVNNFLRRSFN